MHKLAIIIGHNRKNKGAYAKDPINEFEYDYNGDVAQHMVNLASAFGIEAKTFRREPANHYTAEIRTCYENVEAWNPEATVELHFNGAGGKARGCEMLSSGSAKSVKLARAFQSIVQEAFGNPNRGVKSRKRGERGGRSLHAIGPPAILTEPFFGDHPADASKADQIGKRGLAELYLRAAQAYFNAN